MHTARVRNNRIARRAAIATGGLILTAALAVSPATASGAANLESTSSSTSQSATAAESLDDDLQDGKFQIDVQDGLSFKASSDGGVAIVGADGATAALSTSIDTGSKTYTGKWSVKDATTAVFTVTSTAASSSTSSPTVQPMKNGYAHCVLKTAAAATLAAAITGAFTGVGEVAVIPVGFLAGFASGHIACLD